MLRLLLRRLQSLLRQDGVDHRAVQEALFDLLPEGEEVRAHPLNDQDGKLAGHVVNCPGCGYWHLFDLGRWQFNGDLDRPTFSPSMLVNANIDRTKHPKLHRCHSFVRDGKIQFLNDCTHELAGKTVDLPDALDD